MDIEDAQKTHIQLSSRDKCKVNANALVKKNDYSADTTQKTPAVDKGYLVFFGRKFTLYTTLNSPSSAQRREPPTQLGHRVFRCSKSYGLGLGLRLLDAQTVP